MASKNQRSNDEVLRRIQELGPWFHQIDLGNDIFTKTESCSGEPIDHPHDIWKVIRGLLGPNLAGKDVLDVGCNAGFYAVEIKRLGARRVVGVDARRSHIRQAMFVKKTLDLEIEYRRMSVYDLVPDDLGVFDLTLALGLIYHCKHPMLALEHLARVTKELLILETEIAPPGLLPNCFEHSVGGLSRRMYPWGYIENDHASIEAAFNWFLPSTDGLTAMIREVGFDDVSVTLINEERAVFVCRKRQTYADSLQTEGHRGELTLISTLTTCIPNESLIFRINARNSGYTQWLATNEPGTERGAVRLGAHLLDESGEELVWYFAGATLPRDVRPGESIAVDLDCRAPSESGQYVIEFDLVSENITWFEDVGSETLRTSILVEAPQQSLNR